MAHHHPKRKTIARDISWLSFNARVLQEAADTGVPLRERIRRVQHILTEARDPPLTTECRDNCAPVTHACLLDDFAGKQRAQHTLVVKGLTW